ncbi:hypothetical protein BGZ99_000547, partial [Dissophora globulifera]
LIPRKFAYRPGVILDVITPYKPVDFARDDWRSSATMSSSNATSQSSSSTSELSVSTGQSSNDLLVPQTDAGESKDVDYIELISEYADTLSGDADSSSESESCFGSESDIGTSVSPKTTSSLLPDSSQHAATFSDSENDMLYLNVTDRHNLSDSIVQHAHASNREAGAIASHVCSITELSSTTVDIIGKTLVNRSASINMKSQSSLQELLRLHSSSVKATLNGEQSLAASLNNNLQEQLNMSGLQMSDLYLVQMMHTQSQIMDHQVLLQSRIDSLITQTYEMFEYPIPRLFIVLQKPKRHRDMIAKPFKRQFRLFFLCECGEHTMREGNKRISHEIHLAKHEGYDIDQPTEFFRKYGPYVITIMTALKYVVATAGLVIPTLGHFVSGIEAVQKSFSITAHEVRPLMDETIRHIRREVGSSSDGIDTESGQTELDDLEVLEGADLRLLESFLQIKDQSRVLGNLYRIITLTGRVKWVCIDHYRENYRQKAHLVLKDLVYANGGIVYSQRFAMVRLISINFAKRFYEALGKAKKIQRLQIDFKWDATIDDLRRLATAMTNANIENLTLFGSEESKGRTLDAINSGCRYNPILKLMTNSRIKKLKLADLGNFYHHISDPSLVATRCLEYLEIDSPFSLSDKRSMSALFRILKLCPGLKHLIISPNNRPGAVIAFFKDWTPPYPSLARIGLKLNRNYADVVYTLGLFKSVSLQVCTVDDLSSEVENLLRGHISALDLDVTPSNVLGSQLQLFNVIRCFPEVENFLRRSISALNSYVTPSNVLESQLIDAIRYNPCLSRLTIKQNSSDTLSYIDAIISTRRDILSAGGTSQLKEASLSFSCIASLQSRSTISINFEGNVLEPTMSTEVIIHHSIGGNFRDCITALIQQYGWSITKLTAGTEFNEDLAAILNRTTENKGSSLREITLTPTSLTSLGRDCLLSILERSKQLEDLIIEVSTSVQTSICRYEKFITSLKLSGEDVDKQIAAFSEQGVSRHNLPMLKALSVKGSAAIDLSQEHVAWIAEIVSPPHQDTASFSDGRPFKSLRSVICTGIRLLPQDWRILIAALDLHSLSELNLSDTNFALEQLTEMTDLVRCGPYAADSLSIQLGLTQLEGNADTIKKNCHMQNYIMGVYIWV